MKLFVLAISMTLAICPIFAEQYVGGNFGTTYLHQTKENDSPKVGYRIGATYGYILESGVRVEADFAFRNNEYSKKYVEANSEIASETSRSMHSWSMVANLLYDVNQLSTYDLVPYIGFGVGYAHNVEKIKLKSQANAVSEKKEDDRLAYQLIVGAKYPIADKVYAGVQYTYHVGRTHAKNHDASVHLVRNF